MGSFQCFADTVAPTLAVTSVKCDPPISSHFRNPRTISNAVSPLLSMHLSNAASSQQSANFIPNHNKKSLRGHLENSERPDLFVSQ